MIVDSRKKLVGAVMSLNRHIHPEPSPPVSVSQSNLIPAAARSAYVMEEMRACIKGKIPRNKSPDLMQNMRYVL
jgi:hypothetical protein